MKITFALITALLPALAKLVLWFVNADERARERFISELPQTLKGISDENKRASELKDPSIINRRINDR